MIKRMRIRMIYIAVIAILSLTLGSVWLYAQKSGKPTVQWSRKEVVEFILPNTTKNVPVSFRSAVNLNNITFFITPGLRNVLSVSPANFSGISANQNYSLTLTINSGNQSRVKFEGTVHLRDNMGHATTARPLPVTVVVHNEPVPPDPGEAGKQTLEGVDSDNDGVRDDIQRYIVLNYYNSQKAQLALRQYAKALQPFLLDAENKQLSRAHTKEMDEAQDCSYYVLGFDEAVRITDELIAQFLNTDLRSKTYIKADSQLSGMSGSFATSQIKSGCTFNPDILEN